MDVTAFKPARFRADLGLPAGDPRLLEEAATAVRQEFRGCSRWKRLRCRKVDVFAERDRGTVCVVHVGSSIEFDWTWEGAVAFRPRSLDDNVLFADHVYEEAAYEDEIVWTGEILEVDERNGCLFVSLNDPEAIPATGSFFVRPFEFLSVLDTVYDQPAFAEARSGLPARLAAAQGGIHPEVMEPTGAGLPHLRDWWRHSWAALWGPPGTGKTWLIGQQVAAVLDDAAERILVVSTTNRATDTVARSIGEAAASRSSALLDEGRLLRIGKGTSLRAFSDAGLESMLRGTESETLREIDDLVRELRSIESRDDKAMTRKRIGELRARCGDQGRRNFIDSHVRVIVATAFKATTFLRDNLVRKMLEDGEAPFTTIFVDEAGLMSRAAVAALSSLAARRVVLVGDSKQLAPISRISRIMPTRQQTWMASSGLSHLDDLADTPAAIHVLTEQRRMHPDVCRVVSNFQYAGVLETADARKRRASSAPPFVTEHARAIWYVLDEEDTELAAIRAGRGRGNKSWVRPITPSVLAKLFSDPGVRDSKGLFISPFRAQAQAISKLFARWDVPGWEASTVHSQQGAERDVVIFDTVNAGSYSWPFDEWKRLINVALSRAKEAVIVLASRSEMDEPYLAPLVRELTPSVVVTGEDGARWVVVAPTGGHAENRTGGDQTREGHVGGADAWRSERGRVREPARDYDRSETHAIGRQVAERRRMTAVLSREQQRLANLGLDGKPRLVRGVAGSGKSVVLCNWLARTVKRLDGPSDDRIWAVYANRSLHKLLRESIEAAWDSLSEGDLFGHREFPWAKVRLLHVKDVLADILPHASLSMEAFDFDYDRAAEEFLKRLNREDAAFPESCRVQSSRLQPCCSALFVDEAQDMGPSTLRLLLSLVEPSDVADPSSRPAHIFYDNAQNIYGRKTPKWSEFGLDMRGRSTIMRESFRSTAPITELAVNVLHRLRPADQLADQRELMGMGLIEKNERNGEEWLRVRFNQVDGPKPIFRSFDDRTTEMAALADDLEHLIRREGIAPADICVIYNSKSAVHQLETKLGPEMSRIGVELSVQTNRAFERRPNTLVVTTSHSYKGYESEVVLIPCVDQFVTGDGEILANNLYVAMTRARSMLAVYGIGDGSAASRELTRTIADCVEAMNATPDVEVAVSIQDDVNDLLEIIGHEHRRWLVDLWKRFEIRLEPITGADGRVLAEPLFWFEKDGAVFACFAPGSRATGPAADERFTRLNAGDGV